MDAFWEWSKKGVCEVSGHHSFNALKRLIVRTLARDGEVLIVEHVGAHVNKFGYALQILDIDHLDIEKNDAGSEKSNPIRMGVEFNRDTLRPVAYLILNRHPGDIGYSTATHAGHTRIPAESVHHIFVPERAEALCGIPLPHAVVTTT